MSTTVNVAIAELPRLSVALIVWDPGAVCVGTQIKAVKFPDASVNILLGIVGMAVSSQKTVILEVFEKEEPTIVVDAKPVFGSALRLLPLVENLKISSKGILSVDKPPNMNALWPFHIALVPSRELGKVTSTVVHSFSAGSYLVILFDITRPLVLKPPPNMNA